VGLVLLGGCLAMGWMYRQVTRFCVEMRDARMGLVMQHYGYPLRVIPVGTTWDALPSSPTQRWLVCEWSE
jgi:hypothetical protein